MEPTQAQRRYAGLTADERRAERRRRLLDTALEEIGTRGFATTGVERICMDAGVATRHFYEEFDNKEALLTALFDEVSQESIDLIEHALASAPDDPEVRARVSLGAMLHHLLDDPRRARVQSMEVVGVSPEMEAHRRSVLHRYAEILEGEARKLGLPSPDGRRYSLRALALVAATNELMIEWIGEPSRTTIDELVEELVSLYLAVGRSILERAPR